MTSLRQSSFARGEISSDLFGRIDQALYSIAVDTARNMVPGRFGGIWNRPGTKFVGNVKDDTKRVRLIPFIFNSTQSYVLEFGNLYIRFIKSGAYITETPQTISAITAANPGVLTYVGADPANGDEFVLTVAGMTELNGRNVVVASVNAGANTFQLADNRTGTLINTTGFTAFTSGTMARVYTVTTTYAEADLQALNYTQSADVLTVVHPTYPPKDLARTSDTSWTLSSGSFAPSTPGVTAVTATAGAGGSSTFKYRIGAVSSAAIDQRTSAHDGEESYADNDGTVAAPTFELTKTITNITQASPAVVTTSTPHGYHDGDEIWIGAVNGMTQVNTKRFTISTTTGVNAAKTISAITVASPMVVTSNGHGYSNGDKIVFNVTGMVELNDITYGTVTVSAANTFQVYYYGTTTKIDSSGFGAAFTGGTVTRVSDSATTFSLVGVNSTGYSAYVSLGVTSRTYARVDASAEPTAAAPNVITFVAPAGAIKYFNVYREYGGIFGLIGTVPGLATVTGSDVLKFYDIGLTPDITTSPQLWSDTLFQSSGNYPSVVTYFQQRRCYANTNNAVATIWMSQPGYFGNFTTHFPLKASDSINFTLASTEVNAIKGMIDLGKLIIFTSAGEWVAHGNAAGAMSATDSPNVRQSSYNGSGSVRPLIVNANALFLQAQSSTVRDLLFDFQSDNYTGKECTIYANHLIEGYTITDWAYQKLPNSVVWAVRNDGVLLSLTYLREQEVLAWAHHDFVGGVLGNTGLTAYAVVENVVAIPEGTETALYLVIKRDLGTAVVGTTGARYVERLNSRDIVKQVDMAFMDSHLTYDGRNSNSTLAMSFSGGTNYTYDEHLTLTCSNNCFAATDVGKAFYVTANAIAGSPDEPRTTVRIVVDAYTSATQVQGHTDVTVPVGLQPGGTTSVTWSRAVKTVTGLWHLAGQTLSVFADAYVIGSPLHSGWRLTTIGTISYDAPAYPAYTVGSSGTSNGVLVLDSWYSVIQAGLPYVSDLQTLDVDTTQSETLMGKKMIVNSVTVFAKESRGTLVGAKRPAADLLGYTDIAQVGLESSKLRDEERYPDPNSLVTGKFTVPIEAEWNSNGKIFLRQVDPLPITVLALGINGKFPFKQLGS